MSPAERVLVVDDDADVREVLRLFLEARGVEVCEAQNGADALEVLSHETPALVLLDVMMPIMNGPELLAEMRRDARLAGVPVLLITAWPTEGSSMSGLAGVIRKPVDAHELQARIDEHLRPRGP